MLEKIKYIIYADEYVSAHKAEEEHRNQRGIALIATAAFVVMSLLNVKQHSYFMLVTTSISALLLLAGYLLSKYKGNAVFLRWMFYSIFVVIFTSYTVMGGNDGFAVLWLVIATYAVMNAIDFKAGFAIGTYYLVMLLLVFEGPLSFVLQYDYNKTFMLRFPFLYAINFAFATFIVIRIRMYQYELILKQQELEQISMHDLSTGLMNRNNFIKCEQTMNYNNLKNLLVVFIDVNGLHEINNRCGHDAGDKMLSFIADRCQTYFADHAVYRMGGDEFLILCRDVTKDQMLPAVNALLMAVEAEGYSISYGIEMQESNFNLGDLVKRADAKMIACKQAHYQHAEREKR